MRLLGPRFRGDDNLEGRKFVTDTMTIASFDTFESDFEEDRQVRLEGRAANLRTNGPSFETALTRFLRMRLDVGGIAQVNALRSAYPSTLSAFA
jgi:hypothetical protein